MKYTKKNNLTAKKTAILSALLCLFTFSFPAQNHAENILGEKAPEQNMQSIPSLGGKLNLTPQKREVIEAEKGEGKENLQPDEITKENQDENQLKETLPKETLPEEKNKKIQTNRKDIILAPGNNQNSVIMQEDGSNVIIVHGSNKIPENYTNSTNVNNGFYMNITNPDGSGMNMGTYFNSNSSSNSPRKRSRAQIIVDKTE